MEKKKKKKTPPPQQQQTNNTRKINQQNKTPDWMSNGINRMRINHFYR